MVAFALMVFLQAVAFFYRSYLELETKAPRAKANTSTRTTLGDPAAELVADIH